MTGSEENSTIHLKLQWELCRQNIVIKIGMQPRLQGLIMLLLQEIAKKSPGIFIDHKLQDHSFTSQLKDTTFSMINCYKNLIFLGCDFLASRLHFLPKTAKRVSDFRIKKKKKVISLIYIFYKYAFLYICVYTPTYT